MSEVQQLPRGRHGLSREEVLASQRSRLLVAMAEVVAERGYAKTSVAHVIKEAGVSRETFYEQFSDKEDCFLAAYDAAVERVIGVMRAGFGEAEPDEDLRARADRVLRAYLEAMREEPAAARTFLIEVYAAGPAALERRAELQSRFVDMLSQILKARTKRDRFNVEAFVAAVSSMVTMRVSLGDFDSLPELRPQLVDLAATLAGGRG
jgi:AcrR family transcriptional regulator